MTIGLLYYVNLGLDDIFQYRGTNFEGNLSYDLHRLSHLKSEMNPPSFFNRMGDVVDKHFGRGTKKSLCFTVSVIQMPYKRVSFDTIANTPRHYQWFVFL